MIRGEIHVNVTFDPRRDRTGPSIEALCDQGSVERVGRHRLLATFDLLQDPRAYSLLADLLAATAQRRSTAVVAGGAPQMKVMVQAMAACAHDFLELGQGCGFGFERGIPYRCSSCPLFDDEGRRSVADARRVEPAEALPPSGQHLMSEAG